jgi:hypothetical protein
MRWAGHVVCMGYVRNVYIILAVKLEGRDHSENFSADGKIILTWILRK